MQSCTLQSDLEVEGSAEICNLQVTAESSTTHKTAADGLFGDLLVAEMGSLPMQSIYANRGTGQGGREALPGTAI